MGRLIATLGAFCFWAISLPAQEDSSDLYLIELVPTPDLREVHGEARLGWAKSPFGISLSSQGHFRYELSFRIQGLPDPKTLGDYRAYVAWVTTPRLSSMVKVGEVTNGENLVVGTVSLNQFLVLVSAEKSSDVDSREGRLVLRGMSPSSRIQPDNHLMIPAGRSSGMDAHHQHSEWPHPPMHPLVSMIPGLEDLRPAAKPFLPRLDAGEEVPYARPRELVKLSDGDHFDLEAGPVKRVLRGNTYVMYGFNGQYPGPLLYVEQSSTITVHFVNKTPHHTAVHWHGVRLDNRYDGVPGVTQEPVPPGGSFEYRVFFRDAGIYWYHPHHREDIQQDLGLFGNMFVRSADPGFFNEVHREEVLMLDDLLIGNEGLFPYGEEHATHA
ncbi:MAG: multicopper oxidase domain-containing protein, partial [Vicinamibacteria bacterium]